MVLYQDYCVQIELQEASNILCVCWLEQPVFRFSEFELSFMTLMDFIEKNRIKKILARSSKTMIHLPDETYLSVISLLQSGLAHSKVEKVARIYVDGSARDLQCIEYFRHLLNEMQLEIEFQNFENRRSALAWLKES